MKKILLGLVLVFVTLFTHVLAEDNPRAVIIFDASGSMWGQINGTPKIEIARDALKNVVKEWNPNVELGLTVYGHRSKGDCNDIQTVIPVGKVDKNKIISTVMAIKPKGKTPISRSLRKVADELKYTEEKATIILISDGKETCDPDPCGTAKELKKEGIDFITHVIGFNVDKKTDKQLECIANATGGEYFSAKNAAALNKAIKTIAKKVEKPKPVVKNTLLVPVVRYNMSPNGLNLSGAQLKITQEGKTIYGGSDEAPEIDAKVSSAHIKATYKRTGKPQTIEKDFTLKAQKKNIVKILIESGQVTIDTAEEQGGPKVKSSVHIYPIMDGEPNKSDEIAWCVPTKTKACVRVLPVGDFFIEASYNGMKTQKRFTLDNKEKKDIHLYFKQTGTVKVSASEKEGGKWIEAYHRIYKVIDGVKDDSQLTSFSSHKKTAGKARIAIGKYIVRSEYKNFIKETPFELKAGEPTKLHIIFGQFFIEAKCLNMGQKVNYEIYASSGQLVYEKKTKCSDTLKVTLDDGDYSVEASIETGKGEAKFTVGSGKPNKLILDLTNLNHEEEIKADAPEEVVVVPVKPKKSVETKSESGKSEKVTIGGKQIEIKGINKEDAEKLKNLGAMLGALGGMMQGGNQADSKEKKAEQTEKNAEADKEFDEMSKDLDMFTK